MASLAYPSRNRDLLLLAAIMVVGLVVRIWNLGQLGLTHFDEGIYAISGLWATSSGPVESYWVGLVPYAPPGFVILMGLLYAVLGPSDLAAIAVAQLAGVSAIPAVAWLTGRTFGRRAGLVAAAITAVAGPLVAFSRVALTDSLFLLVWVVALGLGQRFLERPGPGRAVLLGIGVGLLQQCKYHGWLVGVIVALAALVRMLLRRVRADGSGDRFAAFRWGLVAAGIAAAVVFPWFDFVDRHGGYGRLLAHQRSYLNGWSHWWPNLVTQWRQSHALAGDVRLALLGWAAALVICLAGARGSTRTSPAGVWSVLLRLVLAGIVIVMPESSWALGLVVLPLGVWSGSAARAVLGVTWLVLAVLTPLYHPYARLWLPIETLGLLSGAALLVQGAGRIGPDESTGGDTPQRHSVPNVANGFGTIVGFAVLIAAVHILIVQPVKRLPDALAPTDAIRTAVDQLATKIPLDTPGVVTMVRPGVLFYLRNRVATFAQPDLETFARSGRSSRWALLDGGLAGSTGADGGLPPEVAERWEVVADRPTALSLPALLDLDPGAASGSKSRVIPIWLLRSRPPGGRP